MRSAISDIDYGLRRNLGGFIAGRPFYSGQNTFSVNGVPGQTPEEVTRQAGVSPLPIYSAPLTNGVNRLRRSITSSIPDPRLQRFAEDERVDASARNALLKPYGIDQL